MTTFTDKEMIKEIKERIGSLDVRDNIERRAYEIALASLEAEAVCVIDQSNLDYLEAGYDADVWPVSRAEMADVFLYRAVPPVPDKIALAIENLKQKLVECNRYNYCADAVKGVEDAYLAAMRHGPEPVSQTCKLNELSSNSPVTPARWISCSTRIPAQDDWILIYSKHGEYMAGQVQGEYVELSDGTLSWLRSALFWMPLPEPPKEVRQ
ncbi:DUF551 domain-containing protein [Escherichia coli]|uniref:DUF551 domain-containing protein n=1 Tax=Escherichia coli TaxID=562 RepID=UPI001890D7F4|nr:DUF551 domain-containing protein [Escherichia coli]MBF5508207.1 DUF551 domain-containing protein [Escherichia coli]MBF5931806.1 DUF551 domain-containing protein [Escherichia coli]HDQ0676407.1 DUF551 domain-containing protein [Escherichia coli]HEA6357033.1 DUF551 domain-containing protein [Escherichia coli]